MLHCKLKYFKNMSYKQTPLKDREGNILLPETIAAAVTDPALGKTQAEINAETITRVELVCDDDQHITLIDDPTPLTYEQVKALVDDTTKFVTLRYLDMWWMLPSYDDGGAIMFTSSDIQGGHVMVTRVILNDDEQMNNYSIVAEDADHKTDDMSVETASDGHRTYPTTHAVNGALATKANTDGYYTELTSGMSEQLLSPDGITDEEPYIYRTSAGSTSISTGVAEIKSLYGNSIVWNQLNKKQNTMTISGITQVSTDDGITTINGTATEKIDIFNTISEGSAVYKALPSGHKGLFRYTVISGTFNGVGTWSYGNSGGKSFGGNTEFIREDTSTYKYFLQHIYAGDTFNNFKFRFQVFDLTQMFGAGNEPTTVEQFKQWFPNDYYEYNAGEIINVNVDGLRTIGFNQWDEEWRNGGYRPDDGKYYNNPKHVSNTNPIKVFPNTKYWCKGFNYIFYYDIDNNYISYISIIQNREITTPANCHYINFTNTEISKYDNNICFNISWSGYRNGDYEPYVEHNINIPVKEIKDGNGNLLFPDGLLSAGSVKDEITSDKAVKRVGVRQYQTGDENDTSLTTDGTNTNYPIATPIEVDFKDVPQTFGEKLNLTYFVDDFGTEEFTTTEPTAPVAHSTFYMTNLRDKIRNIDGNTDSGALMNNSLDNLLTTLGGALGGTLTKTWDSENKKWMFSFTPNTTTLNEEGGEQ